MGNFNWFRRPNKDELGEPIDDNWLRRPNEDDLIGSINNNDNWLRRPNEDDLIGSINNNDNWLRRPNEDDLIGSINNTMFNVGDNTSTSELLLKLLEEWQLNGRRVDMDNAAKLLFLLKNGRSAEYSLYSESAFGTIDNIDDLPSGVSLEALLESRLGFHVSLSAGHTTRRLGEKSPFDYQYRITINNSSDITYSEIVLFTEKFEELCKDRNLPLNIKVINGERDLFICYCDDTNLSHYVQILMDMASESKVGENVSAITKKFGNKKPFTASLGANSYYGVSAGFFKNELSSKIKGSIPFVDTMTVYSAELVDAAYKALLEKYSGDSTKIMVEEFYLEMHKEHAKRLFPDIVMDNINVSELLNVPLWMNSDMYNLVYNYKMNLGTSGRNRGR